ncbi:MAG: thrombospondin type 3 repeat-containing protein [Deferrisomatales bacterium]
MRHRRYLLLGALLLALTSCARNDDDGPSTGGPDGGAGRLVAVTGNVVGMRPAGRVGARVALTGDVAVVLVDEARTEAFALVNASSGAFSLQVPAGHDFVLVFRQGTTAGRTLAVFVADDASGRTVFTLASGAADLALGDIELGRGRAWCVGGSALPGPAAGSAALADEDDDGVPDVADLSDDEDEDGIPDRFEAVHGLNAWDSDDAAADRDGDGLDNLAEYRRGSNLDRPDGDGVAGGGGDGGGGGPPAPRDPDGDGRVDGADNCALVANPGQEDLDGDGRGDACDDDVDGDGVANAQDAFPRDASERVDTDGDGIGNSADPDDDGDGVADASDATPLDPASFSAFNPPVALGGLAPGAPAAASAINDLGQVVGNAEPAAGQAARAVVWRVSTAGVPAGAAVALQGLPGGGEHSLANGNDNAERIVGEALTGAGDAVAVVWKTQNGTPSKLPSLPAFRLPGALDNARSVAVDVNEAGLIVGHAETASFAVHAAAWLIKPDGTLGGAVDLQAGDKSFAGSPFGRANAVSANGLVVGEIQIPVPARRDAGETRAVAWKLSGLTVVAGPVDLGKLPGDADSTALSVNEAGVVVGESVSSSGDTTAVRWTVDPVTLAVTGPVDLGGGAEACAVNRSGRIAGSVGLAGRSETASVWDVSTLTPWHTDAVNPGATGSNRAVALNGRGQVVGIRTLEAFVATPR